MIMSYISRCYGILILAALLVTGCSLTDLINVDERETGAVVDRSIVESPEGARGVYLGAVRSLGSALSQVSMDVASFSDELTVHGSFALEPIESRSKRNILDLDQSVPGPSAALLQRARVEAQQAGDLLRRFGGEGTESMLAHSYAIQAYVLVLMGEMFCSGMPVTSVPYGQDIKYSAGLSTDELFERALLLADSARRYKTDSVPVLTMLRIVEGRALLNLGRFNDAASAVSEVDTDHRAVFTFAAAALEGREMSVFWTNQVGRDQAMIYDRYILSNGRGTNGMDWLSDSAINQDPRVPVTRTSDGAQYQIPVRQTKFAATAVTFIAASGIEARLIEAEALLQPANSPSGDWLAVLNQLRSDNSLTGISQPLPPVEDPGSASARIDLLFKERAYWFFLEGHRLGDMRRLIRQYERSPITVFPIGAIAGSGGDTYGNEFVLVPDFKIEEERNPHYRGCFHRNP